MASTLPHALVSGAGTGLGTLVDLRDPALQHLAELAADAMEVTVACVHLSSGPLAVHVVGEDEGFEATPYAHADFRAACRQTVAADGLVVDNGHPIPPFGSWIGAPVHGRHQSIIGAFCVFDVRPREWGRRDVRVLRGLAESVSTKMEVRAALLQERAARLMAERARTRVEYLAHAGETLSASLDYRLTIQALAELPVPDVADWCAVHIFEDGLLDAAAVHHRDERLLARVRDWATHPKTLFGSSNGPSSTAHGGGVWFEPDLLTRTSDSDDLAVERLRSAGASSVIVLPLADRGRTFGTLTLARDTGVPYDDEDLALAEELSKTASLSVENARLFDRERTVAVALQHSLLPTVLPEVPGLGVAHRYVAASRSSDVGGDWYDIIQLDDGRVGLVVGDVMGHGIRAAAIMGQIRAMVQAYAMEGHNPADLLDRLGRVIAGFDEHHITTCLYALYDPMTQELRFASAGHPPLVLRAPNGFCANLDIDTGPPLGVTSSPYRQASVTLPVGSVLAFYTDGLIEDRTRTVEEGLHSLLKAVADAEDPSSICNEALDDLIGSTNEDDVAILAVRTEHSGASVPLSGFEATIHVDNTPQSAGLARTFLTSVLAAWEVPENLCGDVVLVASELVTNALTHADSSAVITVEAEAGGDIRISVDDRSAQELIVPSTDDDDSAYHGLVVVGALAAQWGTRHLGAGKRVWALLTGGAQED